MLPISFPIANVSVYAAQILMVCSWLVFSFLFWRGLRRFAVSEDRIFDLTFYATIIGFASARLGFIIASWQLFVGKSPLLMVALWISPGLSWLGLVLGSLATFIFLSRHYKVRLGLVLDVLASILPLPIILGETASLLNGVEVGKQTVLPWAIRFVGFEGGRHPVQLYEMISIVVISVLMMRIVDRGVRKKWAYGIVGIWFFIIYSIIMFALEFVKDSHVYWGGLTANQWVLIAIFAECIGVMYVRGGGREEARRIGNIIYAKLSKRYAK